MLESLKYRVKVATFRSGKEMKIPLGLREEFVQVFLNEFTIEEQVDMFCVTETLGQQYKEQDFHGLLAESVRRLHFFFREPSRFPSLQVHLEHLGMRTALQYMKFGKTLISRP